MKTIIVLLSMTVLASGCSTFAYYNEEMLATQPIPPNNRAQFTIERDRGDDGTLFILALSGGGSRAAYFSAQVMLALQSLAGKNGKNLLESVDAISSVSGGSLPAAYYAISMDPNDKSGKVLSGRVWDRDTVEDLMSKNYIGRWIGNWFWPDNIALYWATAYDRSDIMAQTFADNLYDTRIAGIDLTFKDINPDRPYLIINSTNAASGDFGTSFTFTDEHFREKINSDISQYEISQAVMASASFPAVFNYMTLRNFSDKSKKKYLHVFDGGNVDNLGLESAGVIINKKENDKYKKIVILSIDAHTKTQGVPTNKYDARSGISYAVDFNFLDSTDSLLQKMRDDLLVKTQQLVEGLEKKGKEAIFYHLSFNETKYFKKKVMTTEYSDEEESDIQVPRPLYTVLNTIETNFNISDENAAAISDAVKLLITKDNNCIKKIQSLIKGTKLEKNIPLCVWPNDEKKDVASN